MAGDGWDKVRSSLRVSNAFRGGKQRDSDSESEDEPYDRSRGCDQRVGKTKKKHRQPSSGQPRPPEDEIPGGQQWMLPGGYTAQQPHSPQYSPPLSHTSSWPTDPQPPSRASTWASESSNYGASSTASQYPPSQNPSTYGVSTYGTSVHGGHSSYYLPSQQHYPGHQQPQQPYQQHSYSPPLQQQQNFPSPTPSYNWSHQHVPSGYDPQQYPAQGQQLPQFQQGTQSYPLYGSHYPPNRTDLHITSRDRTTFIPILREETPYDNVGSLSH